MQNSADTINFYFAQNGYVATEVDADSAATFMYYLYVNKFGSWYLMRQEAISATQYECKFAKGIATVGTDWRNSDIWTGRDTAVYAFVDAVFKDL